MFFKKNFVGIVFFSSRIFAAGRMCHLLDLRFFFLKKRLFFFFSRFLWRFDEDWRKRKEKEKIAVTKTKTGRGQKNFSNSFFLLNKIKECEYVEFCAPPRYFFFFLRWCVFFFSSLDFANFARCRMMVIFLAPQLSDISRPSTRDPEMRRYWFLFWSITSSTSFRQNAYVSFR